MTEELYICGECVDMKPDTRIMLNFKSNLLGDISKITASNSYTIPLPKTVRNRRIFDAADIPSYESSMIRKKLPAKYYCNGICVIEKAYAVVLSVSQTYEIALTWGCGIDLSPLNDRKLSDILSDGYIEWGDSIEIGTNQGDCHFSFIDFGLGLQKRYIFPVVSVRYIVENILKDANIDLYISPSVYQFIKNLFIPITTKNANEINWNKNIVNGEMSFDSMGGFVSIVNISYDTEAGIFETQTTPTYSVSKYIANCDMTAEVHIEFVAYTNNNQVRLNFRRSDGDVTEVFPTSSYTDRQIFDFFRDIELKEGEHFVMYFYGDMICEKEAKVFQIKNKTKEVCFNSRFPIAFNLPDIKQIDFLKAIMQMTALFVHADSSVHNRLSMYSIEKLYDNKSNARNWSDKLAAGDPNISFEFGNFAQNNFLRYKEDDSVSRDAKGILYVDSKTLSTDTDLVKLPFSATDHKNGRPFISVYTQENDVVKMNKVTPRIIYQEFETGSYDPVFSPFLNYDGEAGLIDRFYKKYQDVIIRPQVIKCVFQLNEIDLKEIDETIPVYISHFGKYFGIISIRKDSKGLCECELLQLN